jgi:hypothetical protein
MNPPVISAGDLVARLLDVAGPAETNSGPVNDLLREAAARIRELEAKLERATADLRDISLNCTGRVDAGGLPALVAKCGLEAIAALNQDGGKP